MLSGGAARGPNEEHRSSAAGRGAQQLRLSSSSSLALRDGGASLRSERPSRIEHAAPPRERASLNDSPEAWWAAFREEYAAIRGQPLAIFQRLSAAIERFLPEHHRASPAFLHIWLAYLEAHYGMYGDDEEVRRLFRFLKSEHVGAANADFYLHYAQFELSNGKGEKSLAILEATAGMAPFAGNEDVARAIADLKAAASFHLAPILVSILFPPSHQSQLPAMQGQQQAPQSDRAPPLPDRIAIVPASSSSSSLSSSSGGDGQMPARWQHHEKTARLSPPLGHGGHLPPPEYAMDISESVRRISLASDQSMPGIAVGSGVPEPSEDDEGLGVRSKATMPLPGLGEHPPSSITRMRRLGNLGPPKRTVSSSANAGDEATDDEAPLHQSLTSSRTLPPPPASLASFVKGKRQAKDSSGAGMAMAALGSLSNSPIGAAVAKRALTQSLSASPSRHQALRHPNQSSLSGSYRLGTPVGDGAAARSGSDAAPPSMVAPPVMVAGSAGCNRPPKALDRAASQVDVEEEDDDDDRDNMSLTRVQPTVISSALAGARERSMRRDDGTTLMAAAQGSDDPTTASNSASRHLVGGEDAMASKARAVKMNGRTLKVLQLIGRGGSSKVFKVLSPDNTILALKKVSLRNLDEGTLAGYLNEIELLKSFAGATDHIIRLYDYEINQEHGNLYMLMEYGEADLSRLLKKGLASRHRSEGEPRPSADGGDQQQGRRDYNFIRYMWQQMLLAVQTVHAAKIVHCDLKPANFLLVGGQLKLIDFGISKAIQNDTTNIVRENQVGTVNYMSPEALQESSSTLGDVNGGGGGAIGRARIKIGRASDVWSLGCILYEMVYGRAPFAQFSLIQRLHKILDVTFPIEYGPIDDPALLAVMQACLTRQAKRRISLAELLVHPFLVPPPPPSLSDTCVTVSLAQMEELFAKFAKHMPHIDPRALAERVVSHWRRNDGSPL